ncbi:MAG: type II toxin-antitoxin system RelE/ParE family toxin [Pseudohongiellaceae bacterium]
MAKYKITFKKSVTKDLRSIPSLEVKRILKKIDSLSIDPRAEGCVKLSAQERYRVRQGLYRIVYEIRDETLIVHVVKVAHRSIVYKNN